MSKLAPVPRAVEVTDALWADLAADAATAYQAVAKLGHAGEPGVALLREHLKPAKPVDAKRLAAILKDLESDAYAARQKAAADLAAADVPTDVLRERLKTASSAEARKVIQKLLDARDGWLTDPQRLRHVRAVEALQRNGSAAAKKLLEDLAAGDPAARLTQEAKEATRR
jgi:hypothetical protein